jgi:hypothetical protein
LDISAHYNRRFGPVDGELFITVLNATDDQATLREQDIVAGQGGVAFGDGLVFNPPRSIGAGIRLGFGR